MLYELIWRNKYLTANAKTIDEMIQALHGAADDLRTLQSKGVTLSGESDMAGDFAYLITDDPTLAAEYGFDAPETDAPETDTETTDDLHDDTGLVATSSAVVV